MRRTYVEGRERLLGRVTATKGNDDTCFTRSPLRPYTPVCPVLRTRRCSRKRTRPNVLLVVILTNRPVIAYPLHRILAARLTIVKNRRSAPKTLTPMLRVANVVQSRNRPTFWKRSPLTGEPPVSRRLIRLWPREIPLLPMGKLTTLPAPLIRTLIILLILSIRLPLLRAMSVCRTRAKC